MAGVFSIQRFGLVSETTIEELKKKVRETWCKQKYCKKIEENEPESKNLTTYSEEKDKNGDDCKPDNLKVMIATLDRHLNEKGYKFSIIREREFHSSKQVFV